ncbi:CCA tRNA nucleotidyltransferase [Labrys neptuniae]|uniref:CCA tRNA nucleotidyltransferase n=1 Tax=Labrys neptuniae TaxID=376174 RepID=UPI002891CEA5|nr:CCA tRNA nucleotidyltransferase [Labrys neptuniae]MDT3376445.1 CCA tRNA nucleotidyltransferase [Labrys neptuniae]
MDERFPWLDKPPLSTLLAALNQDGEEARVVGGAVRNALLGEAVADWDIATTALPVETQARARARGWKVVPTGIEHGTVTVVIDGHPLEVTTLREDIETDGRRAVVHFGRDFRADAFRRDFTINALSLTPDGRLHDYASGLADIAERRVRFLGEADQRIAEDYLRILRLFRFHARFGQGPLDKASFTAAIRGREGLRRLSAERIRAELLKLLTAPHASEVLAEIEAAGFLGILLGGISRVEAFRRLADLEARGQTKPDAIRRLAALSLFTRQDAERLAARLRLSNAEAKRLATIALLLERVRHAPTLPKAREWLYRLGPELYRDGMLVAAAHHPDADFAEALALPEHWSIPEPPFSGRDLAQFGIKPGPRIGRILARAEQAWIDGGFTEDGAQRQALLDEAVRMTT